MPDRILIVDDEESIRRSLAGILADEGFETVTARDGDQAVALLRSEGGPALVLLDIAMPGKDGITLLKDLRAQGNACEVVLITAFADLDTLGHRGHAGASDEQPDAPAGHHGGRYAQRRLFERQPRLVQQRL